jgi:hypothetical protein
MITNPLLEEIWAIKDRLNAESGGDIHVFCQQLRDWSAKNLPDRMFICDPKELRAVLAKKEEAEALVLREEPRDHGTKKD